FLAKSLEPEELAQGVKMLGKLWTRVVHFRLFQELAPGLVREQGQGAQLAAVLEVGEDLACSAFLLFERGTIRSLRAILDERFLGICGFSMNQPHKADELVPRLPVHIAVFS